MAVFTTDNLAQAEALLLSGTQQGLTAVKVEEQRPESLAALSPEISHPQDAAEIEADRIAAAVVGGSQIAVEEVISNRKINRQNGAGAAVMGLGEALLGGELEAAPEEAAAGPPGWVVGGVVLLAAGALIGIGYLMSKGGKQNVADTGIMEEVQGLIAAGTAATICAALALLLEQARRAGDTEKIRRIQRTQKAKGCRHKGGD